MEGEYDQEPILLPPVQVRLDSVSINPNEPVALAINLVDDDATDMVLFDRPEPGILVYYDANCGTLVGLTVQDSLGKADFYAKLLGSNFLQNLWAAQGEPFMHDVPPEEQPFVAAVRRQQFEAIQLRHLSAPIYGIRLGKVFGGSAMAT